jgi:hypothetical protein
MLENFLFMTGEGSLALAGDEFFEGLVKSGGGSAPVSV